MRKRVPWRCKARMFRCPDGCNMPIEVGGKDFCFYHRLVAERRVTEFRVYNSRGSWIDTTGPEVYFPWPLDKETDEGYS